MDGCALPPVESEAIGDFARVMRPTGTGRRLNLEPDNVARSLGQLVLAILKLLHELLERQALRRMEGGSLTEAQVERLGLTLMRQAEELERLRKQFGLAEEDLNLDLGPLGRLW